MKHSDIKEGAKVYYVRTASPCKVLYKCESGILLENLKNRTQYEILNMGGNYYGIESYDSFLEQSKRLNWLEKNPPR